MTDDSAILIYLIGILISIVISYFLFRWIFSIDKQVKQNQQIILLLGKIAQKQGVTDNEINTILNMK